MKASFVKTILSALMVCLAVSSCSDKDANGVVEGLPVTVSLTFDVPTSNEVVTTRASNEAETKVEKMALFFYRTYYPSSKPVVIEIDMSSLTPTKVNNSETSYKYQVNLNSTDANGGLVSGTWNLYAIANYDKKYCSVDFDKLKDMTKAEMDSYVTSGSTDQDFVETSVLMSGKYGNSGDGSLVLQEGENTLNEGLSLRRAIAESVFEFKNGTGVTFTPVSYEIHNFSTSSTLMERSGWQKSTGKTTEVVTDPGSLLNPNKESGIVLSTSLIPISETTSSGNYTFSFYTQENAQATSKECTSYALREAHVSQTDQSFKYAPDSSTYVVVKGLYEGPVSSSNSSKVTASVTYTIHLGDFSTASGSFGNFSVRRNTKYKYDVTVKGVNSIIVESQASDFSEKAPGMEGVVTGDCSNNITVDAHYEQILLSFPASSLSDYKALRVSTPNGSQTWENLADATISDCDWIKFGRPASTSTFSTYANMKDKLIDIKTLFTELTTGTLTNSTSNHYLLSNNTVYVAAYVDEYYYSDLAKDKFVNADDREMTLAKSINTSQDGKSVYTENPLFSIKQRSIKCPFSLELDNPYGLETVEEVATISNGLSDNVSTSATDKDNGWSNSKTMIGNSTPSWSTYVDESKNGWIKNSSGVFEHADAVKSSYKLYGFMTRNRDNNQDGKVNDDELRWYLPARNQCLYLWIGMDALPVQTVSVVKNIKANSTTETKSQYNYLTSTYGAETWWSAEGTAFGGAGSATHLFAVRNLGTYNASTSAISSINDRTITVSGLQSSCYRSSMMTGEYVAHTVGDHADKVYKKFTVNSSTVGDGLIISQVRSDYVVASNMDDNVTDKAYWRIPNEKEFALMVIHNAVNSSYNNYPAAARTYYKGNSNVFYYSGGNITTGSGTSSFTILPVRDAE